MESIKINQKAPNFEIKDFNGEKFNLSEFKGKNILIVLNRGLV